jgi:hypothetical protein
LEFPLQEVVFHMHRNRGGQIGNHNRLKHGFYSKAAVEPGPEDILRPEEYGDETDRNIAVIRMTLRSLLANDPGNHKLISYNVSLLHRLLVAKQRLSWSEHDPARDAAERLGSQLSDISTLNRGDA